MTVDALLPSTDARAGRDRLEVLTALISAPSFDPLFRADIIKIPPGHPVYRWNCLVDGVRAGQGRARRPVLGASSGGGDEQRTQGGTRAGFLQLRRRPVLADGAASGRAGSAPSGRPATWPCGCVTTISPAGITTGTGTVTALASTRWLAGQEPLPATAAARSASAPSWRTRRSGLCRSARGTLPVAGKPRRGGPAVSVGQPLRAPRPGPCPLSTPTSRRSAGGARRPRRCCGPRRSTCAACTRCCGPRSSGACPAHAQGSTGRWELAPLQHLADYGRAHGLRSLTDLDRDDPCLRKAVGREVVRIAHAIARGLQPVYLHPTRHARPATSSPSTSADDHRHPAAST